MFNSILHPLSLLSPGLSTSNTPTSGATPLNTAGDETVNPAEIAYASAGAAPGPRAAPHAPDAGGFTFPVWGARAANSLNPLATLVTTPTPVQHPAQSVNPLNIGRRVFPRSQDERDETMASTLRKSETFRASAAESSRGGAVAASSSNTGGDVLDSLLAELTRRPEAVRDMPWTELINLKTRTIELQIAEAKRKEREAELELARLKAQYEAGGPRARSVSNATQRAEQAVEDMFLPNTTGSENGLQTIHEMLLDSERTRFKLPDYAREPVTDVDNFFQAAAPVALPTQAAQAAPSHNTLDPMTPLELQEMMQGRSMESLFSWLPDLQDGAGPDTMETAVPTNGEESRKRSASVTSAGSAHPSPKKKRSEKKAVVELAADCKACKKPVARLLLRAPKSQMPDSIVDSLKCIKCHEVEQPPSIFDQATSSGTTIGTVETRKRMRGVVEVEDEAVAESQRRVWCDVCQRIVASGVITSGGSSQRESLNWMLELVCSNCDARYQRCTDCGGGGGNRIGIGKWRMKQVFQPGRKTCGLSHSRLGDRPREIGVHLTPKDFTAEQLAEVLARCKALWSEKTYSRLAVPEMLEIDLPPDLKNPIMSFEDVESIVTRNWPAREGMIRAEGADERQFRRLIGLTWAHTRPRRTVRTIDLEDTSQRQSDDGDEDRSTLLHNVRRTDVVIPASCELIGMWGAEWDMENGSLLISNLTPFEGTDGEDSLAFLVGELITKAQDLRKDINATRAAAAAKEGRQMEPLRQCEHLWVVSMGNMPLVRERLAENLIKKRSFVHVDEYLTRHPDFASALKARPNGMHPNLSQPIHGGQGLEYTGKPLVLVRWLGKDFSAEMVRKIKQQEFGGKKGKGAKKAGKGK